MVQTCWSMLTGRYCGRPDALPHHLSARCRTFRWHCEARTPKTHPPTHRLQKKRRAYACMAVSPFKLVAGTGFEPVIPQARYDEPDVGGRERDKPVMLKNPFPPFWALSKDSNLRASLSDLGPLRKTSSHGPNVLVHVDRPLLWSARRLATSPVSPV